MSVSEEEHRRTGHADEPHVGSLAQRLNWLRAGVLGANDGIVSVAAVVVGVAAATPSRSAVLTAGLAALLGGAISMALGEYVSVSSQSDSEKALIAKEKHELATMPDEEFDELVGLYRERGLSEATARQVATELTRHDALGAHLSAELNIDPDDVVSPWHAAWASLLAFLCGGILPMAAVLLVPEPWKIAATFGVVLLALGVAGSIAAWIGGSSRARSMARVVVGGALALGATFGLGSLLGTTGVV
ncbi:VIT family protein [Isoptericola sp. NEAU-Y5]|uniref:VIT family protein n=1 Tax=Isoptericola luteus TaxID=2879484 RepID=A0ABS7ZGU4_9MICO|nr:VIT family protein [Isoptericola sp. NEAU-Y5]MCA5894242.1 VIT family protein [Isoptericola sp. NEAU-Y5]